MVFQNHCTPGILVSNLDGLGYYNCSFQGSSNELPFNDYSGVTVPCPSNKNTATGDNGPQGGFNNFAQLPL